MERDPLTGLPDRHTFFRRLEGQIKCCGQFGDLLGVVVVNLRRFRDINREYGYKVGDALLQETANRIRDALRQSDTVARIGADEFALLLPGLINPGHAQLAAHKINQVLSEPFPIGDLRLRLRSYAGIALFPHHAANGQQFLAANCTVPDQGTAASQLDDTQVVCEFDGPVGDLDRPADATLGTVDDGAVDAVDGGISNPEGAEVVS